MASSNSSGSSKRAVTQKEVPTDLKARVRPQQPDKVLRGEVPDIAFHLDLEIPDHHPVTRRKKPTDVLYPAPAPAPAPPDDLD